MEFGLMRVAALTMSYNEPIWARVWARHYSRQVGAEHCFLLDHGSDDGSADGLAINVERLARSPLDEEERAARVSERAAQLLMHYDAVIHADVDELVLADPRRYRDLRAFAAAAPGEVITAIGLDVQHLSKEEDPLDSERSIGAQRRWVRFSAAMCKPVFVRRPVRWTPGFHQCDARVQTGGLFLLHMRYVDVEMGVSRLKRTRGQEFATAETNPHQRVSDREFEDMVGSIAQLPRTTIPFETQTGPMADWVNAMLTARNDGTAWMSIAGDQLWTLPRSFLQAI